jgi:hypothetical protein
VGARALVAQSCAALDRPLRCPAELWVAVASDSAVLLGAFQRSSVGSTLPELLRLSGGPEVRVAKGTIHVALALTEPGTLVPCDERRIVNRYVRPLLRALARTGHLAHYFGRDWVSVAHDPVAWVGFAHDSISRRTLFEAFVAVREPFAPPGRPSLRGKEPKALGDADAGALADAIADAYGRDTTTTPLEPADVPDAPVVGADPPWLAVREEAIGTLGAGPDAGGCFRVGGDLLVSRDALARLEAAAPTSSDLGRLVNDTLTAPGVALDGVRSLASVRDLVTEALSASR